MGVFRSKYFKIDGLSMKDGFKRLYIENVNAFFLNHLNDQ